MNETTIIHQFVPAIDKGSILLLNRFAQVVGMMLGIQTLYEARIYGLIVKNLSFIAAIRKYITVVAKPTEFRVRISFKPKYEPESGEVSFVILAVLSLTLAGVFILTPLGPLEFYSYPFRQLANTIRVWQNFNIPIVQIIFSPFKSFLYFLWAIVSLSLVMTFGIAIPVKALAIFSDFLSSKLSKSAYKAILLLELILSSVLIFVTS